MPCAFGRIPSPSRGWSAAPSSAMRSTMGTLLHPRQLDHLRHEVIAARDLAPQPRPARWATPCRHLRPRQQREGLRHHETAAGSSCSPSPGSSPRPAASPSTSAGSSPGRERSSFVAEPAQTLVHRDIWSEKGSTFDARRATEGTEFLASTDSWFLVVNMTVGPDGALYVVDYYRQMIEHTEWASTHVHKHEKDMYAGQDRGRIWRIRRSGGPGEVPRHPTPARLGRVRRGARGRPRHENRWWRRTRNVSWWNRRRVSWPRACSVSSPKAEAPGARARLVDAGGAREARRRSRARGPGRRGGGRARERPAPWPSRASQGRRRSWRRGARPREGREPQGPLPAPGHPGRRGLCLFAGNASGALRRDLEDEWVQVAALSASPERASAYLMAALVPGSSLLASETPGRAGFLHRAAGAALARPAAAQFDGLLARVASHGDAKADWWRGAVVSGLSRGGSGARCPRGLQRRPDHAGRAGRGSGCPGASRGPRDAARGQGDARPAVGRGDPQGRSPGDAGRRSGRSPRGCGPPAGRPRAGPPKALFQGLVRAAGSRRRAGRRRSSPGPHPRGRRRPLPPGALARLQRVRTQRSGRSLAGRAGPHPAPGGGPSKRARCRPGP